MARHKIERRGQRRELNLKSTFFGKHFSTLSVHHPNLLFIPCIAPPRNNSNIYKNILLLHKFYSTSGLITKQKKREQAKETKIEIHFSRQTFSKISIHHPNLLFIPYTCSTRKQLIHPHKHTVSMLLYGDGRKRKKEKKQRRKSSDPFPLQLRYHKHHFVRRVAREISG